MFTHLYWTHLPYGKLRFLFGLVVLAGGSVRRYAMARRAAARASGRFRPRALAADTGDPRCRAGAPILQSLHGSARAKRASRVGLSKFARNCDTDQLLETPEEMEKVRYCFPAGAP